MDFHSSTILTADDVLAAVDRRPKTDRPYWVESGGNRHCRSPAAWGGKRSFNDVCAERPNDLRVGLPTVIVPARLTDSIQQMLLIAGAHIGRTIANHDIEHVGRLRHELPKFGRRFLPPP